MDVSSASSPCLHYPDVDESLTLKLGMHFEDLTKAYEFYNDYAKAAGFSVRKDSSRSKDGEVVWKRFFCSKEGKIDEKHWVDKELVQRRRMETRVNCKAQMDATCSCKKFEFEGIPCCHILSVLVHLSIRYLPERYILKRWTKGVTKVYSMDERGDEIGRYNADSFMARHRYISDKFTPIFNEGCQSKEGFEILVNSHTELQVKLRDLNSDIPSETSMHPCRGLDSDALEYNEPAHVVTKGRAEIIEGESNKRASVSRLRQTRCLA